MDKNGDIKKWYVIHACMHNSCKIMFIAVAMH